MDSQQLQEQLQAVDELLSGLLESLDDTQYAASTAEDSDRELSSENRELSDPSSQP